MRTQQAGTSQPQSQSSGYQQLDLGLTADEAGGTTVGQLSGPSFLPVRMAFVRRVYALLTLQLLVTAGLVALFMFLPPLQVLVRNNTWMSILAALIMFVLLIMAIFGSILRKGFRNYLLPFFFTNYSASFAVATISSLFMIYEVLLVLACLILLSLGVICFCTQSQWDYTIWNALFIHLWLFALSFGIMYGIYNQLLWRSCNGFVALADCAYWPVVVCAVCVMLFSLFLAIETTWMLEGTHPHGYFSQMDHVFASFNLYLDIAVIFPFVVKGYWPSNCASCQ